MIRANPDHVSLPTISPLRGLVEVTRLLRAREDLPALLEAVARTIGESLGYQTVAINLYRLAWDDFEVTTVFGNEEARSMLLGSRPTFRKVPPSLGQRHLTSGVAPSVPKPTVEPQSEPSAADLAEIEERMKLLGYM